MDNQSPNSADAQSDAQAQLPDRLDCETLALLRRFLAPVLETAPDWHSLASTLANKGYPLCFRAGHLVILNETGRPMCTGQTLGVPLSRIVARIGRPSIRVDRSGMAGVLH